MGPLNIRRGESDIGNGMSLGQGSESASWILGGLGYDNKRLLDPLSPSSLMDP